MSNHIFCYTSHQEALDTGLFKCTNNNKLDVIFFCKIHNLISWISFQNYRLDCEVNNFASSFSVICNFPNLCLKMLFSVLFLFSISGVMLSYFSFSWSNNIYGIKLGVVFLCKFDCRINCFSCQF
jgi:hypothetical protein